MDAKKRLVVGVSGASGAALAVGLLRALGSLPDWEAHLVVSRSGARTLLHETGFPEAGVTALAATAYDREDIGAAIASGTFRTEGMVIVPCSMKTAAGVACGYSDNLLLRAADVTLKERRKLVVVARETPLSRIHLRNLSILAEVGAVIMPPMLTYYTHPCTVADMTGHMVGKILNEFGIEYSGLKRWNGQATVPDGEEAA
ncbi:3-octaprenyl-4-hydroxybenzoate carboxy-lyase [Pseudodesulfovibrio mercurii]|uniref:Flavin prenyltransferase UbiX n=1 Tax=Pseudodesulfovibrio mercurii TaxID=641491 RepID=F0JC28_9BACT|nr:UbiX family flavin prenyltransferase [Pseudodesulfovibrio mercurii]EGB15601.1 3-octaprenyl-4-hydroxybenzoate carboxy-lyase [Pseudodesulfovibrio mercurii]